MKTTISLLIGLICYCEITNAQPKTFSKVYPFINNSTIFFDAVELNGKLYSCGWMVNNLDRTDRGLLVGTDQIGNQIYNSIKEDGDSINPTLLYKQILLLENTIYCSGYLVTFDSSTLGYKKDAILAKYDTLGNELWYRKNYGFGSRNFSNSTDLMYHNNKILHLGSTVYEAQPSQSSRTQNTVLFWVDTSGNIINFKEFSLSTQHKYEIGSDLEPLADGGFLITGQLTNNGGGGQRNGFIAKFDSAGNTIWFKIYGEQGRLEDLNSVTVLADGNYLACGWRARDEDLTGVNAAWDSWLVKVNPLNGDTIWTKTVNAAYYNAGVRVYELANGNLMVGGEGGNLDSANGDAQIMQLDALGNKLWAKRYGWPYNPVNNAVSAENIYEFKQTSDGGYMFVGDARDFINGSGLQSGWLLKLDSNGCLVAGCGSVGMVEYEVFKTLTFTAYPNPAQNEVSISGELQDGDVLTFFDFTGKLLEQRVINSSELPTFDVSGYANGIYLLQLYRSGYDKVVRKVVVNK